MDTTSQTEFSTISSGTGRGASWRHLRGEMLLLCVERRKLSWFGHLIGTSLGTYSTGRGPRGRSRIHWGGGRGLYIPFDLGDTSRYLRKSQRTWRGRGRSGLLCLACRLHNLDQDKWWETDGKDSPTVMIPIYGRFLQVGRQSKSIYRSNTLQCCDLLKKPSKQWILFMN